MEGLGRLHICACGKIWFSPIALSSYTTNISGEATAWCPNCNARSLFATPAFDVSDIESLSHALAIISSD